MVSGKIYRGLGVLFLSGFCAISSTLAEDRDESGGFMSCGHIAADQERLACYDGVYERFLQAKEVEKSHDPLQGEAELAVVKPAPVADDAPESEAIEQARAEAVFGFPRSTYPDEIEILQSRVIKFGQSSRGRIIVYLENGQVWLQAENRRVLVPDELLMAEIRPGMFGAFFLTLEGKKQRIKVKRIR